MIVQSIDTNNSGVASGSITLPGSVTAGNNLVLVVTAYENAAPPTIPTSSNFPRDNRGNAWTEAGGLVQSPTHLGQRVFYSAFCAGGSTTVDFQMSAAPLGFLLALIEVSAKSVHDALNAFLQGAIPSDGAGNCAFGNLITSADSNMVGYMSSWGTVSAGTPGWTTSPGSYGVFQYLDSAAGAYPISSTDTPAGSDSAGMAIAFSAGAIPPQSTFIRRNGIVVPTFPVR